MIHILQQKIKRLVIFTKNKNLKNKNEPKFSG